MARARTPRFAWVEQGLEALAVGGLAAVRVETLAAQLGVTKGGFYGYFAGRDHLLDAMLSAWEADVTDRVIAVVEADSDGDPRDRLRRLVHVISESGQVTARLDTEIAIRDWARHDQRAADVVARVDERRTGYLRALFGEFCTPEQADTRTAIAISVRLASHYLPLGHPGRPHEDVIDLVIRDLLG